MENIKIEIVNGKIVITIDPNHEGEISQSGKSRIIASTRGNVPGLVPGRADIVIGMNVYTPLRRR